MLLTSMQVFNMNVTAKTHLEFGMSLNNVILYYIFSFTLGDTLAARQMQQKLNNPGRRPTVYHIHTQQGQQNREKANSIGRV